MIGSETEKSGIQILVYRARDKKNCLRNNFGLTKLRRIDMASFVLSDADA